MTDAFYGEIEFLVPAAGQASVLEELHFAHPGATQMKQLALEPWCGWSGIDKDIKSIQQEIM